MLLNGGDMLPKNGAMYLKSFEIIETKVRTKAGGGRLFWWDGRLSSKR